MTAAAWDRTMYIARYGHQSVSEIRSWPLEWADHAFAALSRIVSRENVKEE